MSAPKPIAFHVVARPYMVATAHSHPLAMRLAQAARRHLANLQVKPCIYPCYAEASCPHCEMV